MVTTALIWRELLRECRHSMHFVSRTGFVLILAGLVGWFWIPMGLLDVRTAQAELARYGTMLFAIWALVQYVALVAFTTVRSGALADERAKGQLPLARITCLGDRGVVLGWYASVMGRAAFTMLLALPVLVLARSFGGFTMGQVAAATVVTVAAAAHSGALTLALAALMPSTGSAVAASIILQLLWTMRMYVFGGYLAKMTLSSALLLDSIIFSGSGVAALVVPVAEYAGVILLLVAGYLALAVRLLDLEVPRPGRRIKALLVAADRYFMELGEGRLVFWKPGLGPCRGNAVLWRERAVSPFGQLDHVIRLFYWPLAAMIVLMVLAYPFTGYGGVLFVVKVGLVLIPVLVFGVFLVTGPAATFARERQQGTLPLLAVTPLSARTIVVGKYAYGLRLIWVPLALVMIFVSSMWVVYGLGASSLLVPIVLMVAFMPLVSAELLYVGVAGKSTSSAIIAGGMLVAGVLGLLLGTSQWTPGLVDVLSQDALSHVHPMALVPAIAFALTGASLVPRVRWAGNVAMVGLWVFAPLLIAQCFATGLGPSVQGINLLALLAFLLAALAFALGALLLKRGVTGPKLLRGLVLAGALVVLVMVAPSVGRLVLYALLALILWRAVMYAGPGLLNRAALALLVTWLVYGTLSLFLTVLPHGRPWYPGRRAWTWTFTPPGWFLVLGVTGVVAVFFLWATVRQLDGLMQRNG